MSCHVTFLWANWWIFNRRCLFSIYYIIKFYVLNWLKRSYCNNIKVKVVLVHFIQIRWRGKEKKKRINITIIEMTIMDYLENPTLWCVPWMLLYEREECYKASGFEGIQSTIAKYQYGLYIKYNPCLFVPFSWLW